jgi:hypothetical protein
MTVRSISAMPGVRCSAMALRKAYETTGVMPFTAKSSSRSEMDLADSAKASVFRRLA